MKKVELYKHNKTTYENITRIFEAGNRCAVVQPTGSGKSWLIMALAQDNPDKSIVVFEPNRYIISRVSEQMKEYGIENVVFYTYQKLNKMNKDGNIDINTPDYICLDELHRTKATEWNKAISALLTKFDNAKVLGLTATPQRMDGTNVLEDFGGEVACEMRLGDAIVNKILPTPTYISALYTFDEEIAKEVIIVMNFSKMKQYFLYSQKRYKQESDKGTISKRTYFKKCLVISRMMAQYAIDEYNNAYDEYNKVRRMKEQFKHQGVAITTLDTQIDIQSKKREEIRSLIATLGGIISASLDGWQCCGASYDDLFNFCCCSENSIAEMRKSISEGTTDFSELVCIHCPDYKGKGDFIDIGCYAPLTHSVKEYMCAEMEKACENRDIADKVNNKMFEMFPELKDSCMIKSTDEFGEEVWTDLDGLPVDFE